MENLAIDRGDIIVLMGPPGAGKSVQAEMLAETLHGVHISTGNLFRASTDPRIQQIVKSGGLVDGQTTEQVLEAAVRQVPLTKAIVLDGFPRLADEEEWLRQNVSTWKRKLKRYVDINLPEVESAQRLGLRGRADDKAETIARRWQVYMEENRPLLALIKDQPEFCQVDGVGTPKEVHERIVAAI